MPMSQAYARRTIWGFYVVLLGYTKSFGYACERRLASRLHVHHPCHSKLHPGITPEGACALLANPVYFHAQSRKLLTFTTISASPSTISCHCLETIPFFIIYFGMLLLIVGFFALSG